MGTVFRYSHAIDFGDAATKLAHQAECQRCGLILEAAAVSRQPKDSVSGEDPERSSDKLFACITNRRTCCISNNARPRSCWSTRLLANEFPARHIGIIRAIWVMLSRRSSRQADRQNISRR
jgi:hypothetical protein